MRKQFCKCCLRRDSLVEHHISYEKYGAKKDKTIVLCKDCHNFLHKFVKGSDKDIEFVTRNFLKAKKWWGKKGG